MQLIEIGDARVVHLGPAESISQAIELMEKHGFRHLPVVERGRVVGMVSDRDLLSAVSLLPESAMDAPRPLMGAMPLAQIMSAPAITVEAEAPLTAAAEIMFRENVRAVPLVYKERLAGIVTETDFLKCYLPDRSIPGSERWRGTIVREKMTLEVFTLAPTAHFADALRTMQTRKIRHIPIVENEKLAGIVSDHDLRKAVGGLAIALQNSGQQSRHHSEIVMADVMTRQVKTTDPSATLAQVATIMVADRIGTLPVVESDRLVGIISESDLLRHFLKSEGG
ncbi:MAG TPA: CBS domain-containing protein [Phycisphaerae bacterium]|nr:CBS domain-containing protein [Phycisphaerae bacterium]